MEQLDTESYRLIIECATDMITIHDAAGINIFTSPVCKALLGYSPEELVGTNPFDMFHPEDVARISAHHVQSLMSPSAPPITYRMKCKDQSYKFVETTSKTHTTPAGEKKTFCITRDMTIREQLVKNLERANAKLNELAWSDALTGAANRRKFNERLEQLVLESSRGRSVSLIICDIDHFKVFNDSHGHQAGDATLVKVAGLLMSTCREMDTVCRIGGEEFAVLLPGCGVEGGVGLAERMRVAIEELRTSYGPVTMSFGVCETRSDEESGAALFSRADRALYTAKANGRNRVERFELEMGESPKRLG